jgi:hypothetical protein
LFSVNKNIMSQRNKSSNIFFRACEKNWENVHV